MVCFVILHYVALNETRKCVDSILQNVKGEKHIVIVDNASPNGSGSELKKEYANNGSVSVIKTPSNLGFARGNNEGYKFACENFKPEYIVVMNNDMEICQEFFIDGIISSYEKYHYSIMGPDIYSTKKGYHQNPQTRKLPSLKSLNKTHRSMWIKYHLRFLFPIMSLFEQSSLVHKRTKTNYADRPFITTTVEGQMLHGSCYVFSKDFINAHRDGCFYEKTFMYYEAEILYYQTLRRGEKILYYPEIQVLHHEDVATDCVYKKKYTKSIFSVKCLMQSSKAFIELLKADQAN